MPPVDAPTCAIYAPSRQTPREWWHIPHVATSPTQTPASPNNADLMRTFLLVWRCWACSTLLGLPRRVCVEQGYSSATFGPTQTTHRHDQPPSNTFLVESRPAPPPVLQATVCAACSPIKSVAYLHERHAPPISNIYTHAHGKPTRPAEHHFCNSRPHAHLLLA